MGWWLLCKRHQQSSTSESTLNEKIWQKNFKEDTTTQLE